MVDIPKQAQQPAQQQQQMAQARPPPTPQMRALGQELQNLGNQLAQLGGPTGGNPVLIRPIMHRINILKQQYQQQLQAQIAAAAAQHQRVNTQAQAQAHQQQQQQAAQMQAQAQAQTQSQAHLAQGTGAANGQTGPPQLDSILGAPPAGATPQQQQQWQEQQQRVQQILRQMAELKVKIQGFKDELANTQFTAEQRQAKQAEMSENIRRFQQFQQVLMNAGRNVRAQQAGQQQNQQQQLQQAQQQQAQNMQAKTTVPSGQPASQAQQLQQSQAQANSPAISNAPGPAAAQSNAQNTNSPGGARPSSATLNPTPAPVVAATAPVARPVVAQQVPPSRPTLSNGYTGASSVSSPALAKPPATIPFDPSSRILGKRNLSTLLSSIDPSEKLDPDVEDILLDVADEFIESVVNFSCKLAKHRKSDALGVEDVKVVLEKEWNIRVMGFADDRIDAKRRVGKEGTREYRNKLQAVSSAKSLQ